MLQAFLILLHPFPLLVILGFGPFGIFFFVPFTSEFNVLSAIGAFRIGHGRMSLRRRMWSEASCEGGARLPQHLPSSNSCLRHEHQLVYKLHVYHDLLDIFSYMPALPVYMDAPSEILLAATFPLPFRVLTLIGLGILGWATNLHGLHALNVDAPAALDLRAPGNGMVALPPSPLPVIRDLNGGHRIHPHPRSVYQPIYNLAAIFGVWSLGAWVTFRMLTHGDTALVDVFKYIPALAVLGIVIALSCPWDVCRKRERDLFLL